MHTITSVWCPVMQAHVNCLVDLERTIVRVVCHDYEDASRTCRRKRRALTGGPLGRFLIRASEDTLADSHLR